MCVAVDFDILLIYNKQGFQTSTQRHILPLFRFNSNINTVADLLLCSFFVVLSFFSVC